MLFREWAPQVFLLLERKYPTPEQGEAIVFPPDIEAHVNRLMRRDSRESEAAFFREQYLQHNKDWTKVRVANGLV